MPKSKKAEAVKVVIRARPLNKREKNLGCEYILEIDKKNSSIVINKPGSRSNASKKQFTFDACYPHTCS
jgi:kinesin family protein 3/17